MAVLAPALPALVGKWLWQAGCCLPVSAGKEVSRDGTAAANTYIFLLFPSDQVLNCRKYFQQEGRRCNDSSFLSQPFTARWLSLCRQSPQSYLGAVTQGFVHRRAHCSSKCEEGEKRSSCGWFCFPIRRTTGREGLGAGSMLWQNSTNSSAPGLCSLPQCFCLPGEDVLPVPTAIFQGRFFWASNYIPKNTWGFFFADFYFLSLALFVWNMAMDFTVCAHLSAFP